MQSCTVSNILSTNSCTEWVKANILIWSIPKVWQLMVSTPFPINTWRRDFLLYTFSLVNFSWLEIKVRLSTLPFTQIHQCWVDGCPVAACSQKHALYTTVLAHITEYGVHFRLLPIFTSKPETVREFDWMQMAGSSTQMTVAKFNRKTWEEPHKHTSHILFANASTLVWS